MNNQMRKKIAFLLAFALVLAVAIAPQNATALNTPSTEVPETPPAETMTSDTTPPDVTSDNVPTSSLPDPVDKPIGEATEDEDVIDGEPEGDADAPEGDADAPEGDADAPEGDADAPEGDADAPEGDADAPEGDADAPEGDADAPEGKKPPTVDAEDPENIEETAPVEPDNTDATTISVSGTVIWDGVPDGSTPSVTLSLRSSDGTSRDPVNLTYGGSNAYAFNDLPTTNGTDHITYNVVATAHRIAGYTCKVTFQQYNTTVTYTKTVAEPTDKLPEGTTNPQQGGETPPEGEPATPATPTVPNLYPTIAEGSVNWVDVPEGATPGVTITLGGGDNVSRAPVRLTYGSNTTFTFADLPTKDLENNNLPMYTVAAVADEIENYACSAIATGMTVTVTYVPSLSEETLSAVQAVIDAIAAYPSVETIGNMDPTEEAYAAAVRDYHSIMEMISALSDNTRALVTNLSVMEDATLKLYILGA